MQQTSPTFNSISFKELSAVAKTVVERDNEILKRKLDSLQQSKIYDDNEVICSTSLVELIGEHGHVHMCDILLGKKFLTIVFLESSSYITDKQHKTITYTSVIKIVLHGVEVWLWRTRFPLHLKFSSSSKALSFCTKLMEYIPQEKYQEHHENLFGEKLHYSLAECPQDLLERASTLSILCLKVSEGLISGNEFYNLWGQCG